MTVIIDAGPLIAAADRRDPRRDAIQQTMAQEFGSLVIPAPVTAEVDYMVGVRLGPNAQHQFLRDLESGSFLVECLTTAEYADVRSLNQQYRDLRLGLADLSIVVLARRFDTLRVLTFDERHFRAVSPLQGSQFSLLPADA